MAAGEAVAQGKTMTELICRKTMVRCQTPGMCSPYGGCREPAQDSASELALLRAAHCAALSTITELKAEVTDLTERQGAQSVQIQALRKIISESATACGAAVSVECSLSFMAELPTEIASVIGALRKKSALHNLLPELDVALEDLEMHGRHSDQGYRKLKDWYRKMGLACEAIDIGVGEKS
jgi:hypothetical protein